MTEARRRQLVEQLGAKWPRLEAAQERLLLQVATAEELREIIAEGEGEHHG